MARAVARCPSSVRVVFFFFVGPRARSRRSRRVEYGETARVGRRASSVVVEREKARDV